MYCILNFGQRSLLKQLIVLFCSSPLITIYQIYLLKKYLWLHLVPFLPHFRWSFNWYFIITSPIRLVVSIYSEIRFLGISNGLGRGTFNSQCLKHFSHPLFRTMPLYLLGEQQSSRKLKNKDVFEYFLTIEAIRG